MIIGATSWQIPGTYLENVKAIKHFADFVELLIYTWDKDTYDLVDKEIHEIMKESKISIHLPTDTLENVKNVFDYLKDFDIYRLTMHPIEPFDKFAEVFEYGYSIFGDRLCIEVLENGSFEPAYETIKHLKPAITLDYGHFFILGKDPCEFAEKYENIREIHYHGFNGIKDHKEPDKEQMDKFIEFFSRYFDKDVPVCIELFEINKTERTARYLKNESIG